MENGKLLIHTVATNKTSTVQPCKSAQLKKNNGYFDNIKHRCNLFNNFKGLKSQFACRRQDQCANPASVSLLQFLKHRDHKGRCLARPSAGHCHNITPAAYQWDGLPLYRSWLFVALTLDALENGMIKALNKYIKVENWLKNPGIAIRQPFFVSCFDQRLIVRSLRHYQFLIVILVLHSFSNFTKK